MLIVQENKSLVLLPAGSHDAALPDVPTPKPMLGWAMRNNLIYFPVYGPAVIGGGLVHVPMLDEELLNSQMVGVVVLMPLLSINLSTI